MKIWITKFALTKGIREVELDGNFVKKVSNGTCIRIMDQWGIVDIYYPGEWHENHDAAIACAEDLRQKELARLQSQVDSLQNRINYLNGVNFK